MINKAEQFHVNVLNELVNYTPYKVDKYFMHLFKGDNRDKSYWKEVYRQYSYPCYLYQYLAVAIKMLGAKNVIEIGADRGVSALMMASEGANVYSVDIRDGWEYVKGNNDEVVKRIRMIQGNSIEPDLFKIVPELDLTTVPLWFIDGLHTYDHVTKELALYWPHFTPGTIILLDDVSEYEAIWDQIPGDKFLSRDIHGGGVGIVAV